MRVITWDTEIMCMVDSHHDGWDAARRGDLGIACVCLFDTHTDRFHVYGASPDGNPNFDLSDWDADELAQCIEHLNSADVLVGFNSIAFDTPALQGFTDCDILPDQYDILAETWRVSGRRIKGYGLNAVCSRLGLGGKNLENGESAPKLYAKGKIPQMLDYCLNDVSLTRKLARHINDTGAITTPTGEPLSIKALGAEV